MRSKYVKYAGALQGLFLAGGAYALNTTSPIFTFALLPDTQNYTIKPSAINYVYDEMNWIVNNSASQNLVFAYGLGDIQQDGVPLTNGVPNGNIATGPNDTRVDGAVPISEDDPVGFAAGNPDWFSEWDRGSEAYTLLDHANVPYYAGIGRHDYFHWGIKTQPQTFLSYFGPQRYAGKPSYGGGSPTTSGGDMTAAGLDYYSYMYAGGYKFLNIALQFDPDATDLAWAQNVINQNKGMPTIVFSADALDPDVAGFRNTAGQNIWNNLINNNSQIFMMLAAHIDTTVNLVSNDAAGLPVVQVLTDYETDSFTIANGYKQNYFPGAGFMRTLQMNLTNDTVSATSFSPTLQALGDPKSTLTGGSGATAETFTDSLGNFQARFGPAPYLAGNSFYWDPTDTNSANGGGSGSWSATTANFFGSGDVAWSTAQAPDQAVFGGSAGAVTPARTGVSASKITFNTSGYVISGSVITAYGAATIDTMHGSATISSAIAGTAGLTVTGGFLSLTGSNTFTGGLNITNGATVSFLMDNNLGGAGQSIELDGGTLSYDGNIPGGLTESSRFFNITANGATFDVPNTGPFISSQNGKLIISGTDLLGGSGTITKTGPGWVTLIGDNSATFSGNWVINNGVIEVGGQNVLGGGNIIVNNGGELSTHVSEPIANNLTVNTGGTLSGDFGSSTVGTFSGSINANGNFNVRLGNFYSNLSQAVTLTGNISGTGRITTINPATGSSSPANQMLTVTGNNLNFSGGFAIPSGAVAAGLSANNTLGTGPINLAGGRLALQGQLGPIGAAGAIGPAGVSGFTTDTILGTYDTAGTPTAGMDGPFNFFENGYETTSGFDTAQQLTHGLPGQNLTSAIANTVYAVGHQTVNTPFALQSFSANNTLMISEGSNGALTLNTSAAFSNLAILAASVFGADETPALTIHFTDGTSVTTTYKAYDWSAGTDGVKESANIFGTAGIYRYSATQSPGLDARDFGMYETDIDMTDINGVNYSNKLVSSISFAATTFDSQDRGATAIFAVSGAAYSLGTAAGQNYLNNVMLSADSNIDVSGSLNAAMNALAIGSNKLSVTSADTTANPYDLSFHSATLNGNAIFDVAGGAGGGIGTLSLGTITGSGTITKTNAGILRLASLNSTVNAVLNLNGGALEVDANTSVNQLLGNSTGALNISGARLTLSAQNGATVGLAGLSITNGGVLDLGNGNLTVNYGGASPVSIIAGYIAAAYDQGRWDGGGIMSSAALASGATTLGYADTGNQVLVKYTWYGDLNLDGVVNSADLTAMAPGGTSNATWTMGDFNYDGLVNADDYALFALGDTRQNGSIAAGVPEPGELSMLAATGFLMLRRRR